MRDQKVQVASMVLFSRDPKRTASFYATLGVSFEGESHGAGPSHEAADVGGIHLAVYPEHKEAETPAWRVSGTTFVGFFVSSLERAVAQLKENGCPVIREHEWRPWGCRTVIADPDGRPVEVNQRNHCTNELSQESSLG